MKQRLLTIFTRTPLHVGAGSSVGAIDQPIIRERHTQYPVIPGSSLKGVLRDHARLGGMTTEQLKDCFGSEDPKVMSAGQVSFGEARLLAFPIRSAKGSFALATSALALRRYARDAGLAISVPNAPDDMTCLAGPKLVLERGGQRGVVLEEYRLAVKGEFPTAWESHLSALLTDAVLNGSPGRFVLLSDTDLTHFAVSACQVHQHVRIDDKTGTADGGGLFNEETVPSEALFYAPLTELRSVGAKSPIFDLLAHEQLVQFGGNGSTGLGFCTIKLA